MYFNSKKILVYFVINGILIHLVKTALNFFIAVFLFKEVFFYLCALLYVCILYD